MTTSNDNGEQFARINKGITEALGKEAESIDSPAKQAKLAMQMEERIRGLGDKAAALGLRLDISILLPDRGKPKDVLDTELHELVTPHFVRALKAASDSIGEHYFPNEEGPGSVIVRCKAMTHVDNNLDVKGLLDDDDTPKTVN